MVILSCTSQTGEQSSSNEANPVEATTQGKEEQELPSLKYTIEQATEEDFSKAAAKHITGFSMGKYEARKVNGVINLKINGEWKPIEAFTDTLLNTDDPDIREYKYLGQNKDLNKYLVAGSFYEDYQTYLVDMTTGEVAATTWTEPVVSPDKKHLANISIPTVMEPSPNGIQVWNVVEQGEGKGIEKYLEIEQQDWEPFEMRWESSQAIIMKVIPMEKYELLQGEPKQKDFAYLRLIVK
ncbi:hypothetical protein DXT99_25430 [Pontibacter diazotrophicus]|uniref:Uncharacterized protein n=1 Tax=Pontibacter diazotrophicus TaxID=1400979 RepID=A0A3D8L0W7_9BACT|nr:hypothetical protein DXT99_25430 [Pontibacter diazotrophicus]